MSHLEEIIAARENTGTPRQSAVGSGGATETRVPGIIHKHVWHDDAERTILGSWCRSREDDGEWFWRPRVQQLFPFSAVLTGSEGSESARDCPRQTHQLNSGTGPVDPSPEIRARGAFNTVQDPWIATLGQCGRIRATRRLARGQNCGRGTRFQL